MKTLVARGEPSARRYRARSRGVTLLQVSLSAPRISRADMAAATRALRTERMLAGESVEAFESAFARFVGARHSVAVSNGTIALAIALRAAGIGEGDRVVTSSASFVATANAIVMAGAEPVFVDIDPVDCNISAASVVRALRQDRRIRAVVPVHLYGRPCDLQEISERLEASGVRLIEDGCQAHGARVGGQRVGSFGRATAFSFYPSKNMTVGGDGGMITTNDGRIADEARILRDVGRSKTNRYLHIRLGYTARLPTVNAAIGLSQLKSLERWNRRRAEIAAQYFALLDDINNLVLPGGDTARSQSSWYLYVVRSALRSRLQRFLALAGIETGVHYPIPIHLQPIYRSSGSRAIRLPLTERWAREVLSLPMHQHMTDAEVEYVSSQVRAFFRA